MQRLHSFKTRLVHYDRREKEEHFGHEEGDSTWPSKD